MEGRREVAEESAPSEVSDFESLKEVEFAGAKPKEETEEATESSAELTLEEKVARLREPFEEDQPAATAREEELSRLQSEIDAIDEEIERVKTEISALQSEHDASSKQSEEAEGKLSTKILRKIGLKVKSLEILSSRRNDIVSQIENNQEHIRNLEHDKQKLIEQKDELEAQPSSAESIQPLSVEEKERLLTPEALSELSLDEYISLWRRLNPFYASHVTRQGVRDHIGSGNHSTGSGAFSSGFTSMLKDGKNIRAAGEVTFGISSEFSEEDVRKEAERYVEENAEIIDKKLADGEDPEEIAIDIMLNHGLINDSTGNGCVWGDMQAIHCGRNCCLSEYYGAEKGNEVVCIFPIDVIASQSRFNAEDLDQSRGLACATVTGDRGRNNLYVWTKTSRLSLDSGIVFLPKSTPVSPETGSVYETSESVGPDGELIREPILDEEVVEAVTKAVEALISEGFFEKNLYEILRNGYQELVDRLEKDFGIKPEISKRLIDKKDLFDKSLFTAIENNIPFLDFAKQVGIDLSKLDQKEKIRLFIRYHMKRNAIGLKKAEGAIAAEEYWENYFKEHPEQRPKHVVYYDGDPSEAVDAFMVKHGIAKPVGGEKSSMRANYTGPGDSSKDEGPLLGYEHHKKEGMQDEDDDAQAAKFRTMATRMVADLIRQRKQRMEEANN